MKNRARVTALALILTLVLALGLFGGVGYAKGWRFEAEDMMNVASDEVIDGDLYWTGNTLTVNGTIKGDLLAIGSAVEISGTVEGDVMIVAGKATVSGKVSDDLRVIADDLKVSGTVGKNLTFAAREAWFSSDAVVRGGTACAAENLTLSGMTAGDVWATAGDVDVSGNIDGNVRMYVGKLHVLPETRIGGSLYYEADEEGTISNDAEIAGGVTFEPSETVSPDEWEEFLNAVRFVEPWLAFLAFGAFVVGVMFVLMWPVSTRRITRSTVNLFLINAAVGLLGIVAVPVIAALAAILGFAIPVVLPLALIALVIWGLGIYIGRVLVYIGLGDALAAGLKLKGIWGRVLGLFMTVIIAYFVTKVPIIGWIVSAVLTLAGFGVFMRLFMPEPREPQATVQDHEASGIASPGGAKSEGTGSERPSTGESATEDLKGGGLQTESPETKEWKDEEARADGPSSASPAE